MFAKNSKAYSVYLLFRFVCSLAVSMSTVLSIVYHLEVVQLDAFQLVLVGTVQETSCFLFEMPTGVVADLYSRRRSVLIGMFLYGLGFLMEGGAVITYYDENSGTYSEIDVNEDGTYIAPRGQISTSDLSLSFTYSRSPAAKNTKLSYIKVTYNYNWLNLPFFRWQDPTSVSWDDSKFQMTDNSFSKVDKYDGYVIGPNGELLGPYTNQTHSSENGYANASNAGVSWYADLKGYIGVQPTKLYGSGTFKLAPKSTTTSGSTTLYGHYVHPKAELGLSVNVSSYGSFSISGGSNYDERGSQKTISW